MPDKRHSFPAGLRPIKADPGDPYAGDILRRDQLVEPLVKIVRGLETPASIAVHGAWGSGKTTALGFLARRLREEGLTIVEVDAWATEYASEPLIPMLAGILDQLRSLTPKATESFRQKLKELKTRSSQVVRALMPEIAGELAERATGGLVPAGAVKAGVDASTKRAKPDPFKDFRTTQQAIDDVRSLLSEVLELRPDATDPVVLIVDELDRCRPSYALAYLERIQHIIGVEGVVTVLGADLDQLEASVKCMYGDVDSQAYLMRMIPLSFPVANPGGGFLFRTLSDFGVGSMTGGALIRNSHAEIARQCLGVVCEQLSLSLREMGAVAAHLARLGATTGITVNLLSDFLGAGVVLAVAARDRDTADRILDGRMNIAEFAAWLCDAGPNKDTLSGITGAQLLGALCYSLMEPADGALEAVLRQRDVAFDRGQFDALGAGKAIPSRNRIQLRRYFRLEYDF